MPTFFFLVPFLTIKKQPIFLTNSLITKTDLTRNFKYAIYFGLITALATFLRFYFIETYSVLSISMNKTLYEGDKVLLFKTKAISNGDIVIFNHGEETFVKRCLGMPGQTVSVANDSVSINGKLLGNTYAAFDTTGFSNQRKSDPLILINLGMNWSTRNFGPYLVPKRGLRLLLNEEYSGLYRDIIAAETHDSPDNIARKWNGKIYSFQSDYYFMVGDNRARSQDSRTYGAVPQNDLIGKAECLLYSTAHPLKRLPRKLQ
jgi:signal peptidase I